ncbi:hypothetical protein GF360_00550 [candidate division WWE3 bacterium]|nr:hypothetical protein [candidate division WWE3 bacterium]
MEKSLSKNDVTRNLWNSYKKSEEYAKGMHKAIPENHPLIQEREKEGLQHIYSQVKNKTAQGELAFKKLKKRTVGSWVNEWKKMHSTLFGTVLKEHGHLRKNDVRFGGIDSVEKHKIPTYKEVPREINKLAYKIPQFMQETKEQSEICKILAKIHYQFIRIHPFYDGNGRIARVLTDQISVAYGLPPAIAGYPRHDKKRREAYHKAIDSCAEDSTCESLALWIEGYISKQKEQLA